MTKLTEPHWRKAVLRTESFAANNRDNDDLPVVSKGPKNADVQKAGKITVRKSSVSDLGKPEKR